MQVACFASAVIITTATAQQHLYKPFASTDVIISVRASNRIDKEGTFHTEWFGNGHQVIVWELGDTSPRVFTLACKRKETPFIKNIVFFFY